MKDVEYLPFCLFTLPCLFLLNVCPNTSPAYGHPVVLADFVEMIIISPLNCLSTLVKNQFSKYVRVYFWTLLSSTDPCVCFDAESTLSR